MVCPAGTGIIGIIDGGAANPCELTVVAVPIDDEGNIENITPVFDALDIDTDTEPGPEDEVEVGTKGVFSGEDDRSCAVYTELFDDCVDVAECEFNGGKTFDETTDAL